MSKSLIDHTSTQEFSQNPHFFSQQKSGTQIDSINIGLASPIRIRKWAERILPNGKKVGEVVNSKTVNYKTLKPEIGGLFCEKIFGPIEDFECLCAPTKRKSKTQNKFCPDCDVEFTVARVRRYRLGYIKLASPVSHIWYLRGRPRFLNILFDRAIALKTGKKKGKIKDFKPIIYGIDGIYVPILRLIKTNKKIYPKSWLGSSDLNKRHNFTQTKPNFKVNQADKIYETNQAEPKLNSNNLNNLKPGDFTNQAKTATIIKKTALYNSEGQAEQPKSRTALFAQVVPTSGHNNYEFYSLEKGELSKRSMLRIKPKWGSQNKKKSLFILRGRLLGLKKSKKLIKIFPRFPRQIVLQSIPPHFIENLNKTIHPKFSKFSVRKKNNFSNFKGLLITNIKLKFKKSFLLNVKQSRQFYLYGRSLKNFIIAQAKQPKSEKPAKRQYVFSGVKQTKQTISKRSLNKKFQNLAPTGLDLGKRSSPRQTNQFGKKQNFFLPSVSLQFPKVSLQFPEVSLKFPDMQDNLKMQKTWCKAIDLAKRNILSHPFGKKRKKINSNLFSIEHKEKKLEILQSLNFLNFPYYTVDFPKYKTQAPTLLEGHYNDRKTTTSFSMFSEAVSIKTIKQKQRVQRKKNKVNKIIIQKIPTKVYASLFKYNFFEKNQVLWHNLSNYNVNPNIYDTLQFFFKTRYFTQKSRNTFFRTLDKQNILFKKKLSKIICNSSHCQYTLNSMDNEKNLDFNSINFNSRFNSQTSSVYKKNKNIIIASQKTKKINNFLYNKKLFLNRKILQTESLFFFTEQKMSTLPVNQYKNQSVLGFPVLKSKFFRSQKNLISKNNFIQRNSCIYKNSQTMFKNKENLIDFLTKKAKKPEKLAQERLTNDIFKNTPILSKTNVPRNQTKFFFKSLQQVKQSKSEGLGQAKQLRLKATPMLLDSVLHKKRIQESVELPKSYRSDFISRFVDGELKSTSSFFQTISSTPTENKTPGFMFLTSSVKSIFSDKKNVVDKNKSWINQTQKNSFKAATPSFFGPRASEAALKKTKYFSMRKTSKIQQHKRRLEKNRFFFVSLKHTTMETNPIFPTKFYTKQKIKPGFKSFQGKKNFLDFTFKFNKTIPIENFLKIAESLENDSHFLNQNLKTKNNIQSQIDSYYPLCSRCVFKFIKGDENKTLEFKALWNSFAKYMTSNFVKQDAIIQSYSNRLCNRYIIQNGFEYKYIKVVLTGSEAICYWLKNLNVHVLESILKKKIKNLDDKIKRYRSRSFLYKFQQKTLKNIIQYRRKVYRIVKLVYYLKKNKLRPDWLMISILPVLPPNLRPIIQLQSNQIAVSDLNQLYKRVLYRNLRIEKYLNTSREIDSHEIRFHQRLLQEAVDSLLDNGKGGSPVACSPNGRPFKSLAEILKGKKGRFRQNLLGKRVDYSGRSVIVVGPELKLHECGLPKEMALELFQPFIIRDLINLSHTATENKITIITAKHLIKTEHSIVWEILQKILKNHPILLNRAPTLHRLGIQAFQPKLVQGRAILLHPLVCPSFNADFDGDQMAVHIPLCFQSRAEAWKLMWSRNNLLSPATGEPIIIPSQDMILGCYYLTTINSNNARRVFSQSNLPLSKPKSVYLKNLDKKSSLNLGPEVGWASGTALGPQGLGLAPAGLGLDKLRSLKQESKQFSLSTKLLNFKALDLVNVSEKNFIRNIKTQPVNVLNVKFYKISIIQKENKNDFQRNLWEFFPEKKFITKIPYELTNSAIINPIVETRKNFSSHDIFPLQNTNLIKSQFKKDIYTNNDVNLIRFGKYFYNLNDVLVEFSQNKLFLHSLIWVKWENSVELENFNEKPLEIRIDCYGNIHKIYSKYFIYENNQNARISQFILTTVGRIILNKVLP